jgi:hypothetical protein
VTDRGEVVAELRKPGSSAIETPYPALLRHAREGKARLGASNRPDLYAPLKPLLSGEEVRELLEEERGER